MRRMCDIRGSRLDAAGNRVVEIELTAVRTHPEDVAKLVRRKGPFSLRYEVSLGDHRLSGAIDPEQPIFELVFEHGRHPHGVWELRVEAEDESGRTREIWRQWLFVQTKLRRTVEEIDALAMRYSPVFVFSGAEKYYPVSLETLLGAEEIMATDEVMKLKTVFGKESVPIRQLAEFMRFNGHCNYLLDFSFLSMRRSVFALLGGDPRRATIYYSYLEDPASDRFFINYHLFYAFDTKAGIARLTGIGPHVFDRESMIMVFEGESGEESAPSAMIISGHLENQTISFLAELKRWTQGRLAVRYDDPRTLKMGTHPVIAVAEGSHALYPTSGVYQLSLLRELAGYLDPKVMASDRRPNMPGALAPTQVLSPPALRATVRPGAGPEEGVPHYRLASLDFSSLTSHVDDAAPPRDPYRAYLTFSGFWVDVPGTQNARFPPFTRKVAEIVDWVDGAYAWAWDDVPERYHQNNAVILGYLRENLEDF